MLLEMPQRNEPRGKMPMAEANTRRGPKRWAIQPLIGIKTARLSVYLASTDFMFSGATCRAAAMAGTPVLRMVVSSDSMKNATAMSQGRRRLLESDRVGGKTESALGAGGIGAGGAGLVELGCISLRSFVRHARMDSSVARFTSNNYRPSETGLHRRLATQHEYSGRV